MSACPNCGYVNLSTWRQNRWRTNVWFLQWDQTQDIDSTIYEALKKHPEQVQTDKYYAYRNAKRVIERVLLSEYRAFGIQAFHIPREHVNHRKDPSQRKLLEVSS